MKKIKKYAKTTLCMALSAAMLLMNMETLASAAEYSLQEEERTEESKTEETETEEPKTAETQAEMLSTKEVLAETIPEEDADVENTTAEIVTETEEMSEEETSEAETVTEIETEETVQKTTLSDTADIASGEYKEDGNDITWVIDAEGKLTVEGTGDFGKLVSGEDELRETPWADNAEDITTAVINVTGMSSAECMFMNCSNLTSIDLSGFNTSSVTSMGGMFVGCKSLTSINLSGFDTSNVTDMSGMFVECSSLTSIDLSSFNTSRLTDMSGMFLFCSNLTNIDLSGLDTSSVIGMSFMFYDCKSLTNIDLSDFDTSNVTDMYCMFSGCESLTSIDLSSFDTSSVIDMTEMFYGCSNLTSIDVSGFDTSSVNYMDGMFSDCSSLTSIDVSGFDTRKVELMRNMFNGCSGLTSINVSSFDISRVEEMQWMFRDCSNLTSIDLSGFDMGISKPYINDMFSGCDALTEIYTPRNVRRTYNTNFLSGTWYDAGGNEYTGLPLNKADSILICKGEIPQTPTESIAAKKTKTAYACGDELNIDDITVIYYGEDGTAKILAQTDYTTNVSDINMNTAGEQTLTVTKGTLTADIRLTVGYLLDERHVTVTLPDADAYDYVYDTQSKEPIPTVVYNAGGTSVTLTENTDYMLSYSNNINAYITDAETETAENAPTVIFTGCGVYWGEVTKTFEIQKADAPEPVNIVKEYSYSTEPIHVTLDISDHFAQCGSVTGYRAGTPIENDSVNGDVFAGGLDIDNDGSFQCQIKGEADDFVTIPVTFSFANYQDSVLNIKLVIKKDKKKVTISGIEVKNSVYNKMPVSYGGTPKVEAEADDTNLTETVKLTYRYSGTQSDNTPYPLTDKAPVNAGTYRLTVAVDESEADYTGSAAYDFTIEKAPLIITARDMYLKIGAQLPEYQYDTKGLLESDSFLTTPSVTCPLADTSKAGNYEILVSGADAGMNYEITYEKGTLTVSETGESVAYYTVVFHLSGHGANITNTGVKEGSLLEELLIQEVKGYLFTGWFKDPSCTDAWNFEEYTVQSDTTLYAGWEEDKDDSNYTTEERADYDLEDDSKLNCTIAAIKPKMYDQNPYEPVVKVTVKENKKKITLTEGADYRVFYVNNINAGKGTVIIKGNGIYSGKKTASFTIRKKPVKKLKIITGSITGDITGRKTSELPIYVYDGTRLLSEGTDYKLSEQPQKVKAGVQVTVTGMGNYEGKVYPKLTVYDDSADENIINSANVSLTDLINNEASYTGKAVKPEVEVKIKDTTLDNKKNYKVQYQNNINAGKAFVIVTGKGEYKGTVVVPFTIKAETVASGDITIKPIPDKIYNRKLQKPAPTVSIIQKDGKTKKLVRNKDYTVSYKNNFHQGEAEVIITGKGNYYEGLSKKEPITFRINQQQIKKAAIKGTKEKLEVTYSQRKLKEGIDYEITNSVELKNNKVELTITGKGDFTGEVKKSVKKN